METNTKRKRFDAAKITTIAILTLLAAVTIYPFLLILMVSLKTGPDF